MNPDQLSLGVSLNGAGDPFQLEQSEMSVALAPQDPSAYAQLLVDVFEGDQILSVRADETEEAWRIIEPILDGWARGATPLVEYPAGSTGPVDPAAR